MLESMRLSIRCVLPMLLLIALGMGVRRLGWLSDRGVSEMDRVSFRLLLPLTLFRNIYTCDFHASLDVPLLMTAVALSLLSFGIALLVSGLAEKDMPRRAALAQGMFRNNCVLYGLPIITSLFGEGAAGTFSMLLAVIIPLNNILAVLILSLLTAGKRSVKSLAGSVLRNPFVISAAIGILLNLAGLRLPSFIEKAVGDLSQSATPIALLLLGASLRLGLTCGSRKDILMGVGMKLVGLPLLFLPVLVLAGMRGAALVSLYLSIGTPCAVSSHIMARQMGADSDLAGLLVVLGALCSMVTLFLFLTAFSMLSLL